MSYRRRDENVFLSSILGVGAGVTVVAGLIFLLSVSAGPAPHEDVAHDPAAFASPIWRN